MSGIGFMTWRQKRLDFRAVLELKDCRQLSENDALSPGDRIIRLMDCCRRQSSTRARLRPIIVSTLDRGPSLENTLRNQESVVDIRPILDPPASQSAKLLI
jgi:hypothetical protein